MSNHRYHLEPSKSPRPASLLLYITSASSDKDWHSLEHTHYFTEIFYITQNDGSFLIDGQIIPAKAGSLVLINPGVSHTELGSQEMPWKYLALGIEGLQFGSDKDHVVPDFGIYHPQKEASAILSCFTSILKEAQNPDAHSADICQSSLELLLSYTARYSRQEFLAVPPQKASKECRILEQYIKEHFAEEITLNTLSEITHLNKYYLVHAFKKYKGVSPMSYLTSQRIFEAMHLLEATNYPAAKIAGITGFSSQSYFSQAFKRLVHLTPNQYRKKLSQN